MSDDWMMVSCMGMVWSGELAALASSELEWLAYCIATGVFFSFFFFGK